jgi:putative ABC transport system permease protein
VLTLIAVAAAFALFGLLQTVDDAFAAVGHSVSAAHRLVTFSSSRGQALPLSLYGQIEHVPGVQRVTYNASFFATWQRPDHWVGGFAVPASWFEVLRGYHMPAADWRSYFASRVGLLAGESLARRNHWRVGEEIALRAVGDPRRDGSEVWTFVLTGIYRTRRRDRENTLFFHWRYFNAARAHGRNTVGAYLEWIADPHAAGRIARAIDARSVDSAHPTRTLTSSAEAARYVSRIADVRLIAHAVMAAVLFTLLLLTGNTLAQGFRERIPELAVLKTAGFDNGHVALLLLAESLIVCMVGGLIGLTAAGAGRAALLQYLWHHLGIPYGQPGVQVWFEGLGGMWLVAMAVGLPVARRAHRLPVGEALAAR